MKKLFVLSSILFLLAACSSGEQAPTPVPSNTVLPPTRTYTPIPPTPQALKSMPAQTGVNDTAELFSSNRLGLCFSYPQGYTQTSSNDTVEIAAPDLPGAGDTKGRFWLEISDSYNRTAERIADEDMKYAVTQQGVPLENLRRWTITLGGEQAVVLDGMPGQELQRRVYIVRQQTLYVLAFWPARSENKAAGDQMETLYATVTNSWAWFPCSASE